MKEVWFIRHGESASNANELVEDIATMSLTENGRIQAEKLSLEFPKAPDLVVVTPYIRTRQTAEYCLKRFPSAKCEEWNLQEFTYISPIACSNTKRDQRKPLTDAYWQLRDPDYIQGEGAESFSMMLDRVKSAHKKLQDREENFIAVFTHGLIMRTMLLMEYFPGLSNKEFMDVFISTKGSFELGNCEIMRANVDATGVHIIKPADNEIVKKPGKQPEFF